MVRSKGETWEGATALQELLREQVILILTLVFESLHLGYIIFWGGGRSTFGQVCTTMQNVQRRKKKVRKYLPNKYLNQKPYKHL